MLSQQIIAITPPAFSDTGEALRIAHLLRLGVGRVHIRKPDATVEEIEGLIRSIPRELRSRCILSHHIELVRRWGLGGVHLSVSDWSALRERPTAPFSPSRSSVSVATA